MYYIDTDMHCLQKRRIPNMHILTKKIKCILKKKSK